MSLADRPAAEAAFLFSGTDILIPPGVAEGADGPESAAWAPEVLESPRLSSLRIYRATGAPRAVGAARLVPGDGSPLPGMLPGEAPRSMPFRSALALLPRAEAAAAAKGLALLNWLETARHCGACGGILHDDEDEGWESGARKCADCGRLAFPRVSPAVIVLVRRAGKALLAHNASFPAGRFGLIAGFVEPGETFEEAARRELFEEARVEVSSLRYVASQPWPFPDSLMIAFEADWAAGEGEPDGREITELRWCAPDELPSIPPPGSVARALIDAFVRDAAGS